MLKPFIILSIILLFTSVSDAQYSAADDCSPEQLAESLMVGGLDAELIGELPVALYDDPSTQSELIAQLPPGTLVFVGTNPRCNDDGIWWQAKFDLRATQGTRYFGWVQEFTDAGRQLDPIIPTLNAPHIRSTITPENLSTLHNLAEIDPLGLTIKFYWSPLGNYLAVSNLWAVWVYNLNETYSVPRRFPPTAYSIWNARGAVAFSPDEETIAVVELDSGDLHLWSLSDGDEKIIPTHADDYAGVAAISPDLSEWAIAHSDGSISLWDAQTGAEILTLTGHPQAVGGLEFTPDGSVLISMGSFPYASIGGRDNTVRLWDTTTGAVLAVFEVNIPPNNIGSPESRIAITPDGQTAVVFSYVDQGDNYFPSVIYMIDTASRAVRRQYTLSDGVQQSISFSPDGLLMALNVGVDVTFLDPTTGKELYRLPFEHLIWDVAFSPDGRWLAVVYENPSINRHKIELWGAS